MKREESPKPALPMQYVDGRQLTQDDVGTMVLWSGSDVGAIVGWSDKRVYVDFGPGKGVCFVFPELLKWK